MILRVLFFLLPLVACAPTATWAQTTTAPNASPIAPGSLADDYRRFLQSRGVDASDAATAAAARTYEQPASPAVVAPLPPVATAETAIPDKATSPDKAAAIQTYYEAARKRLQASLIQAQAQPAVPVTAPAPQSVAPAAAPAPAIDLTSLLNTIFGGMITVAGTVFLVWLPAHMKDKQAAAVIGASVKNAVGAIQQAGQDSITALKPTIKLPGVTSAMAVGVQYVLDNAGPELKRFTNITPEVIAEKIEAQIGLKSVETNIAVAGSAMPLVPAPLSPIPIPKTDARKVVLATYAAVPPLDLAPFSVPKTAPVTDQMGTSVSAPATSILGVTVPTHAAPPIGSISERSAPHSAPPHLPPHSAPISGGHSNWTQSFETDRAIFERIAAGLKPLGEGQTLMATLADIQTALAAMQPELNALSAMVQVDAIPLLRKLAAAQGGQIDPADAQAVVDALTSSTTAVKKLHDDLAHTITEVRMTPAA